MGERITDMERLNLGFSIASSSGNANQLPPHPSSARPPSQPKASRNVAVERQRQLKDRLKLGWSSKPVKTANSDFSDATGIVPGGAFSSSGNQSSRATTGNAIFSNLVKGYGEQHFADSVVLEEKSLHGLDGGSLLGENSSVFTEHVSQKRPRFASPSIEDTKKMKTAPDLSVSFYSTKQNMLGASSMMLGNSLMQGSMAGSSFQHGPSSHKSVSYKSKLQSHLSLSQSLAEEGMEAVVDTLVSGKAGFCYLQKENNSFYEFSIKDNVPQTMLQNEYITLSANGVTRANADGGFDIVDFQTLARERNIYMKLKEINLFRSYYKWKMFYVWKAGLRRRRFEQRVRDFFLF